MFRPSQKPRKQISAQTIEHGVQARRILDQVTAAPPLEISWNGSSIVLRLAAKIFDFWFGVTSGSITTGTRASPASGTVTLCKWTGSGLSTSGMPNVTALSIWSGGGTGIASGKTVFMIRLFGLWFILGWDC